MVFFDAKPCSFDYKVLTLRKSLAMESEDTHKNGSYKKLITDILIRKKMFRDPDFSAHKLGEMLGVPNYKVSRILQTEFGKTYADIVLSARVKEAMKMLRDDKHKELTVDDIGMMVGFKNKQSFFNAFHKYGEMTPEKWRRCLN